MAPAIDPFDPNYIEKNRILGLQQQAEAQNKIRLQAFYDACTVYVHEGDKAPVPVIPNKITIDPDTGARSEAPFPGLTIPTLPTPAPSSGTIAASNPPPDRTDQIIAILKIMNGKLDTLLAGK